MSPSSSGTGNTRRASACSARAAIPAASCCACWRITDGFSVGLLTAERRAGQSLGAVFPHLDGVGFPDLVQDRGRRVG